MKRRSVLSILLTLAIIASCFMFTAAAAPVMGDVDGDGAIKAGDARLALRTSVGLETLSAEQFTVADVDFDGAIKAADARLILRASVGLETLTPPPSQDIIFNGHKVDKDQITIETGITCIDPDCDCGGSVVMPSFNTLVNSLKTPGSRNYFYSFSKVTYVTPQPTVKPSKVIYAGLAEVIEGLLADSVVPGTVIEYSDFTKNRHVNNSTFYVHGEAYVSALTDEDVESVKMEKMSGVDFVNSLPAAFTSTVSGQTYNLTSIKGSQIGDVYKVTVTLRPESISNDNIPDSTTPIEKILNSDYNEGLKTQMNSLNSAFSDMPEMADMIGMEMDITTSGEIIYYFTADTYQPVAAVYNIKMNTNNLMHTYFNNLFQKTSSPTTTLTIKSDTLQENYFFFNDFFTIS